MLMGGCHKLFLGIFSVTFTCALMLITMLTCAYHWQCHIGSMEFKLLPLGVHRKAFLEHDISHFLGTTYSYVYVYVQSFFLLHLSPFVECSGLCCCRSVCNKPLGVSVTVGNMVRATKRDHPFTFIPTYQRSAQGCH